MTRISVIGTGHLAEATAQECDQHFDLTNPRDADLIWFCVDTPVDEHDESDIDSVMVAFSEGDGEVLLATNIIEAGLDVPRANTMVVWRADRFGLAQLHQLRGRVGRGPDQSFCLLVYDDGIFDTAKRRLTLLRDTEDGFVIADEDYRLRGGGELLGTRQSGTPGWKLADPERDEGLLRMAARDAAVLLDRDPKLHTERGEAIRLLLKLFRRSISSRNLRSG